MSTPPSPDTTARPPRPPGPQHTPQQAQIQPTLRPQIQMPTRGEYLIIMPNNRQQGVQGFRYPFIPIRPQQMMTGPGGATILPRPTTHLIRGVPQQNLGVHQAVIPTSQPYGIANVPTSMAAGSTPIMMHPHQANRAPAPNNMMSPDEAREKSVNLFHKLITQIHIESRRSVVTNLIQDLIDNKKTPQDFSTLLQAELGSAKQPQLVPFLEYALPYLRQSMLRGDTELPGIRPPTMQPSQLIQQITTDNRIVLTPAAMNPSNLVRPSDGGQPGTSRPPILSGTISTPPLVSTPTLQQSPGNSQTKKKKVPLPPGQKSAYAIKKEAREARKRERELAMQSIKLEKTDDSSNNLSESYDLGQQQKLSNERSPTKPKPDKAKRQEKQKKQEKQLENLSATLRDDDDVNDVAAMGGVNLAEESQKIMASGAELVGTQIRSCKDEPFLDTKVLSDRIARVTRKHSLGEPSSEVVALISHATQERLKDIVERLGILAEHRAENLKLNPKYEISNDIKGQMKFLAELDRVEKRRNDEKERELLLRVAKSRSKIEDPEQQKLRQKAKDMQRAEQEEVRQREANMTALLAIGPRKKMKTATGSIASMGSSFSQSSGGGNGTAGGGGEGGFNAAGSSFRLDPATGGRSNVEISRHDNIRRIKRVNMRDLQVLFELDRTYLDRLVKITAQ